MTCFDAAEQLHEYLDRRAGPMSDELQDHLDVCGECQCLRDELVRMVVAAANWNRQEPRVDLADSVLSRWSAEFSRFAVAEKAQKPRSAAAGWFVAAAALAILMMAGIGWQISEHASLALKERQQSAVAIAIAKHSTMSDDAPPLDELFQDARDAYAVLASQAWQQAATTNLLLPPSDAALSLPTTPSLDELPDKLVQPLSPLGQELRDAVNSLWNRVFPNQETSS